MRLTSLLLTLLALNPQPVAGQQPGTGPWQSAAYRIGFLSGKVLAWDLHASAWVPLKKGGRLSAGALLQMPAGGALTAQAAVRARQQNNGGTIVIESAEPAVIRFGPQLLRRRQVAAGYADTLDWGKLKKEASERPLAKAWHQFNALLLPGAKSKGAAPEAPPAEGDVTAPAGSVPQVKIPLLFPRPGMLLVVDAFPATLVASWEPTAAASVEPSVGDAFRLFLWSKGQRPVHPVADTGGSFVNFPLNGPGTYGMRIESADGKAVSDPVEFHVSQALH